MHLICHVTSQDHVIKLISLYGWELLVLSHHLYKSLTCFLSYSAFTNAVNLKLCNICKKYNNFDISLLDFGSGI